MSYGDFTILLSRQRSGTNAVRSVLESNPEIFCFNEVFNFGDRDSEDPFLRSTNFFNFLDEYARKDFRRISPDRHEQLFLDFLEYLHCFTPKRHLIIDVKHNMTHFFTKPWTDNMTRPYLLDLAVKHELRVLRVTRKNYLRYVLSLMKARQSGNYSLLARGEKASDSAISLNRDFLLSELEKCFDEDTAIEKRFASYPFISSYDYAELFAKGSDEIARDFRVGVAGWLGVPNSFEPVSNFRKQSFLPLAKSIENYDEVVEALTGTRFEYCLEDEPMYLRKRPRRRRKPAGVTGA